MSLDGVTASKGSIRIKGASSSSRESLVRYQVKTVVLDQHCVGHMLNVHSITCNMQKLAVPAAVDLVQDRPRWPRAQWMEQ